MTQAPMNYIMIRPYIKDNGNYYPIYADYQKVSISNPFSFLRIESVNSGTLNPNLTVSGTLALNTAHTVSVKLLDDKLIAQNGKSIPQVTVSIVRLPPALFSLYNENQANIMTITLAPGTTSDADGKISFTFTLKDGMVGNYIIAFGVGTLFSMPIQFNTNMPYTGLTVTQSPTFTNPTAYGSNPGNSGLKCSVTGSSTIGAVVGYGATVSNSNARLKTGIVASNDFKHNHQTANYPVWITYQLGMNVQQITAGTEVTFSQSTVLDGDQDNVKVLFYCYIGDNIEGYYI
jgi:hypothetical protein